MICISKPADACESQTNALVFGAQIALVSGRLSLMPMLLVPSSGQPATMQSAMAVFPPGSDMDSKILATSRNIKRQAA